MVRKQSLANKQRSQKNRNKKRARTIRSMRQVNGGVWFSSRAKVGDSTLSEPLLPQLIESEVQRVDESPMAQRYGRQKGQPIDKLIGRLTKRQKGEPILQPLMTKSPREKTLAVIEFTALVPRSDDSSENKTFPLYKRNDTLLENYLRIILYNITDDTAHPGIHEYIYDETNYDKVISPILGAIDYYIENASYWSWSYKNQAEIKEDYEFWKDKYNIESDILKNFVTYKLEDRENILMVGKMIYADIKSQNGRLLFDLIKNMNQLYLHDSYYFIMAIFYTLTSIFKKDAQLQEPWINVHRADIYNKYEESKQSKGGSKGKMRRPKSRTRKS